MSKKALKLGAASILALGAGAAVVSKKNKLMCLLRDKVMVDKYTQRMVMYLYMNLNLMIRLLKVIG